MSTYTVSNTTELTSALAKASGGDIIELKSGNYGSVDFKNLNYSSDITITSADPDNRAVFGNIDFQNSNHIRLDNVEVNGSAKIIKIYGSDYISVVNSKITGPGPVDNVYAIYTNDDSDHLNISYNDIQQVGVGPTIFNADHVTMVGNFVDNVRSDFYKFGGVTDLLFENNVGGGNLFPAAETHADFMQFQGSATDVIIRGNVFLAQNNERAQGIFLDDYIFTNVLIEQNIVYSGKVNAIKVENGSNITVRDNTLLTPPDKGHDVAVINVPSGAKVENNIYTGSSAGWSGSNLSVQYKNPSADYYYDDLFANADKGLGVSLEDLRPVAGSPAETTGAYDRLMELLDGDSGNTGSGGDNVSGGGNTPTEPDNSTGGGNQDGSGGGTDIEYPTEPETTPGSGTIEDAALNLAGDHEFASAADVIEIAPDAALALDAGTIALSFNADSVSGRHGIITKDAYGYGDHFAAYIQNGTLKVRFQDGDSETFINVTGIKANTDYDLQVSFGGGDATVWLNGQKAGEIDTAMSWENNGEYLQVGANGWASKSGEAGFGDLFDGTISDVLVVGGEYDPAGLDALANAAPEPEPEPEPETPTDGGNTGDNGGLDLPGLVFSLLGDNEFNGSRQDAFNQAHDAALELEEGTIAFSFNADKVNGKQGLISKDAYGYTGGGNHFTAWIQNGDLKIRFQDGEDDAEFVFENLKANTDYDVQAYFDGDTVGVLVDGKSIGEQTFDMDLTTNREYLQAGGMGWASETGGDEVNNGYDGTLTDVMIFDTAISQATDFIAYIAISQAMDAIA